MNNKEKGSKYIIYIIIVGIIVSIILCFIFMFNITRIKKINPNNYKYVSVNNEYVYKIVCEKENNYAVISGYLYKKINNVNSISSRIVIKSSDKYYMVPTTTLYIQEFETNEDNNRIAWSGFKARSTFDNDSQILILFENNGEYELIDLLSNLEDIIAK